MKRWDVGINLFLNMIQNCQIVFMRKYITNKFNSVFLPYEEGMIEWLNENYPYSQYRVMEII